MSAAPAAARDQLVRLLTLVPMLHAHDEVRLSDAATALDVAPEQLVKDLKVLFLCGRPGGYPDDLIDVDLDRLETEAGVIQHDGVIRVSNADYLARPLRLSATEASAMIVALRALRSGAPADTREVVDRVLGKLESAAAEGPSPDLVDPGEDSTDAGLVALATQLQAAADRKVQVQLSYYVPSRDEESTRIVDPWGIETVHGFDYLDAWCHSAEAPRLFRLDRIGAIEVLESAIEAEPSSGRDLSEGLFTPSEDTTRVTLLLAPAARWILEYYPIQETRTLPDGLTEADLVIADERWLTRLLLRLAPHASVVSPPEFAEAFTAAAQETLSLYGGLRRTMETTDATNE